MTSQQATCSHCGRTYRIDECQVGREATCRGCGKVLVLISSDEQAASTKATPPSESDSTGGSVKTDEYSGETPPSDDGVPATHSEASASVSTGKERSTPPSKGASAADRFEILGKLGAGAFGTVYQARDQQLDREVALKIPQQGVLNSKRSVQRFLREARAAGNLRHPNIVPIYDAGRLGKSYFIASGFIDGCTLDTYAEQNKLSHEQIARLIAKMGSALHYAHTRPNPVVHRDMKPSNVMIDTDGEPMILDFGMARRDEGDILRTQEGQHLGTPAYMSPEQHAGQSHLADSRSDQWALGVMLYELLTGERPFDAPTVVQIAYQVRKTEPEKPSKQTPQITRDLETIILKCLEKEPDRRYPTCQALSDELTRYIRNKPIEARPITGLERGWRLCKRNPAVAALTASVILALCLGTVVSTYFAIVSQRHAATATRNASNEERQRRRADAKAAEAEANASLATKQADTARRAKQLASRRLYVSQMNLAQRALERDHAVRTRDLLNQQWPALGESDLRGFEWYLMWRKAYGDRSSWKGHTAKVSSMAFSPDGNLIASASDDSSIRLWDRASAKVVAVLDIYAGRANGLGFLPNGQQMLATVGDEIRCWDLATLIESTVWKNSHPPGMDPLIGVLSHDGRTYAVGANHGFVTLWNVVSGEKTADFRVGKGRIRDLAFSPNNKTLAIAQFPTQAVVWDVASNQELAALGRPSDQIHSVAFSASGDELVTGGWGRLVRLWSTKDWSEIAQHPTRARIRDLAFSPVDSKLAIVGDDHLALLWNLAIDRQTAVFPVKASQVWSVAFSPDGKIVATGGCGGEQNGLGMENTGSVGFVELWSADTGAAWRREASGQSSECARLSKMSRIHDAAFSPDGATIALVDTAKKLRTVDAGSLDHVVQIPLNPPAFKVAYSPGGDMLATAHRDRTIRLWHPTTLDPLAELTSSVKPIRLTHSLCFSHDGRLLADGRRGHVNVWDLAKRSEIASWQTGDEAIVRAVAFSPDNRRLAAGTSSGRLVVWDLDARREHIVHARGDGGVSGLTFINQASTLAVVHDDPAVEIWDVDTATLEHRLKAHNNNLRALCVSRDGRRLVTSGLDGWVVVWDVATWQPLMTLRGHSQEVGCVALSPSGRELAVAAHDWTYSGNFYLWRGASDAEIFVDLLHDAFIESSDPSRLQALTVACWHLSHAQRDKRGAMSESSARYLALGELLLRLLSIDSRSVDDPLADKTHFRTALIAAGDDPRKTPPYVLPVQMANRKVADTAYLRLATRCLDKAERLSSGRPEERKNAERLLTAARLIAGEFAKAQSTQVDIESLRDRCEQVQQRSNAQAASAPDATTSSKTPPEEK